MTDEVRADIQKGDTERNSLMDMASDYIAELYLKLKHPQPFRAARYHSGYVIEVAVREIRTGDTQPKRVTRDEDDLIEGG